MPSPAVPADVPGPLAGLRVLVASHVRLYREGIAGILTGAGGRVVALVDAADGDLVAAARAALAADAAPAVAVLDTTMPDALATLRRLAAHCPSLPVVALGVREEPDAVVACAEAGAAGYVARESGAADLVAALRGAARGEVLCSPRVAAELFRRMARPPAARARTRAIAALTPREREVLALIDRGLSNKEIAARLRIGLTTVKNHVHRILEKLHAGRRGEAAALARGAIADDREADAGGAPA